MLWIIGWGMLAFRPSWGFLAFFTGCLAVLSAIINVLQLTALRGTDNLPAIALAVGLVVAFDMAVFAAVGAIIVAVRGGKMEKRAPNEKELDAEMARIRADIAARDGPPPGPPAEQ